MSTSAFSTECPSSQSPFFSQQSTSSSIQHDGDGSPYRAAFTRSLALQPRDTLHFSTYGMGLAPDVSFESVQSTHAFLTANMNEIWPLFFEHDLPAAERNVLASLGLTGDDYSQDQPTFHVNFGANVHEFLVRLFSCHRQNDTPLTVVTSDAEFVSLTRQLASWSHVVDVTTVPLQPHASFGSRLRQRVAVLSPTLVHVSAVYSNSQYRFPDAELAALVDELPPGSMCIVDVAQAFENVVLQLPRSKSLVVAGSGVKHATAGPGMGFVAFPVNAWTPANTGWIAHLGSMTRAPSSTVEYTPELAFAGGTPGYHYAVRQFNDVQAFYSAKQWTLATRHAYVLTLQAQFIQWLTHAKVLEPQNEHEGVHESDVYNRSKAIVLTHSQADKVHHHLVTPTSSRPTVFHCDVRLGDRLRLGFGLHHVPSEVRALADAVIDGWHELHTTERIRLYL
ncbi:hypothetical protein DYB31_010385 [Aphanomyces astaci]|uniref:Aminotransferase class V domain-containing protein n=1 Tax=Aphanomyces astaci TaxID=112090 RepID=A0A397FM15_APHAT|nr:hypothetical protein DYB31_010385 [Aphanomyces astaci]